MNSTSEASFWLIAGANGVGKTTYAFRHLQHVTGSLNFINMDEIARGLSPLAPKLAERDAARIALARASEMIESGRTFAMETTMSGNVHLRLLEQARVAGLKTKLLYFSVQTPEICFERVARRVAEGGHDVEQDIIVRRFTRSHLNLKRYTGACDLWRVFEVSGAKPCLALEGQNDTLRHTDEECLQTSNDFIKQFRDHIS